MGNDTQDGSHDEGRLGAVLEAAQAGRTALAGDDSSGFPQISDVIADYQQAASGHEIDLSALFDNVVGGGESGETSGRQAMAESPPGDGVGDEIDLSALFNDGGHAESAQATTGLPAEANGEGDGFATFSGIVAYTGVVNVLYGDDSHDHIGTTTG